MKQFFFIASILTLLITSSCLKESRFSNDELVGDWTWESSYSSTGTKMFATDTNAIFSIRFNSNNSFVNGAACVIGGHPEGNYRFEKTDNGKILYFKTGSYTSAPWKVFVSATKLTITETNNGQSWNHIFFRN